MVLTETADSYKKEQKIISKQSQFLEQPLSLNHSVARNI